MLGRVLAAPAVSQNIRILLILLAVPGLEVESENSLRLCQKTLRGQQ